MPHARATGLLLLRWDNVVAALLLLLLLLCTSAAGMTRTVVVIEGNVDDEGAGFGEANRSVAFLNQTRKDQKASMPSPPPPPHPSFRVLYQTGSSEEDLPICSPLSVCNRVDTYDSPWAERQCRCPDDKQCSLSLDPSDGHTIVDKTRQLKLCQTVEHLPKCRYFRDVTWTFINYPDNMTQQVVHCTCPKNSVAYIIKRQAYQTQQGVGYQYSFACSPQSRLRCQRKEPCRLFTVKKRAQVEEVNSNTLCQCPHGHRCPRHHLEAGVIPGKVYTEDSVRTYSGYCL